MFVEYLEGIIFGFTFPLLWKQIIHTFSQTILYSLLPFTSPTEKVLEPVQMCVCVCGGGVR